MLADEFNFLRPEIRNYKAEAAADSIPIPGQLEEYKADADVVSCCLHAFVLYLLQI